ncbi:hypothetical protein ACS0TY_001599 [Phlomoides rotata]
MEAASSGLVSASNELSVVFVKAKSALGTRYARINRSFMAHCVLEELISFTKLKSGAIVL